MCLYKTTVGHSVGHSWTVLKYKIIKFKLYIYVHKRYDIKNVGRGLWGMFSLIII